MNLSLAFPTCRDALKGGGRALPMTHVAFRTSSAHCQRSDKWAQNIPASSHSSYPCPQQGALVAQCCLFSPAEHTGP